MTRRREELIAELVADLRPAPPARPPWVMATAWLLGSWLFVTGVTWATGPFRAGFDDQLAREPRFLGEMALGLLAEFSVIHATLSLGIPSPLHLLKRVGIAVLLVLLWVGETIYELFDPTLAVSMLGKREHCYLQALVFGIPPLLAALWILRRNATFDRVWAGALAGTAAALMPAIMMEIACMYVPLHVVTHHVAPIAALAVLGACLGRLSLKPA